MEYVNKDGQHYKILDTPVLTQRGSDDLELVGELTATFVVAAKMEDEGIEPDSRVADGIRAVLDVLAQK